MKRIFSLVLTLPLGLLFATAVQAETGVIQQIFTFPCPNNVFGGICAGGYRPNTFIQASDGNFYGAAQLTTFGTSDPQGGTLFKVTPSGLFTLLFTFTADEHGNYVNGNNPASGLLEANDGFLYGTTFEGGANNDGVLFRISKTGTGFEVVHSFCSATNCADGNLPHSLLLGHDGNLFGATSFGGSTTGNCAGGCGTIFRFSPPNTFTTIFTFDGSSTQGADPIGLIQGADGNFYGVNGDHVFRFTLGGQLTLLTTFPKGDSFVPPTADGGLVQASNGVLYGPLITYAINQAQFYEIHPSGTGFKEFPQIGTLEVDFSISSLIQASDGNLWTAFNERSATNGVVVALSPSTGAVVHQFDFDGNDGATPEASVVQGADGKIYGTATAGGTLSGSQVPSGVVWALDAGLPAPKASVGAFTPTSGAAGTKVMIRGDHFIGATKVTFNGVSAAFQVLNVHFIQATVSAGATTGPIAVVNAGGKIATTKSFTVE